MSLDRLTRLNRVNRYLSPLLTDERERAERLVCHASACGRCQLSAGTSFSLSFLDQTKEQPMFGAMSDERLAEIRKLLSHPKPEAPFDFDQSRAIFDLIAEVVRLREERKHLFCYDEI